MGKGCTAFWKHINQSGRLSSPSASLEGRPPEPLCTGSPYSTSEDTMVPFNLTLRGSFLKPALSGFCALLKAIRSLRTSIFAPGFKRSSQPPADMELPCPTARARRPPPRRSRRASPACSPPDRLSPRRRGLTGDQLLVFFGWSRESQVTARYVHLSGREVDEALAKPYGLAPENAPTFCPPVRLHRPGGLNHCPRCSALLSLAEGAKGGGAQEEGGGARGRVVWKLIELVPDVVKRALVESGAPKEIEPYRAGAAGGIRTRATGSASLCPRPG